MAAVEFLAFGAYVHKVLRNDEDDDGELGTANASGLRCRLWCRESPPEAQYRKARTFGIDLTKHPGATPNFTMANVDKQLCDAPGMTAIGQGTPTTGGFATGKDYVNRIYLSLHFWSSLGDLKPRFPPMDPGPLAVGPQGEKRRTQQGPMDFEFKAKIFATDDPDAEADGRRGRRYIGYYADVLSKVAGTANTWNVRVFHWADSSFKDYQLDFDDRSKYAPQTQIVASETSSGALYLDSIEASHLHMSLPKLPPGQSFGAAPGVVERELVPTTSQLQQLERMQVWR